MMHLRATFKCEHAKDAYQGPVCSELMGGRYLLPSLNLGQAGEQANRQACKHAGKQGRQVGWLTGRQEPVVVLQELLDAFRRLDLDADACQGPGPIERVLLEAPQDPTMYAGHIGG